MSTWAIGDVQGCHDELVRLLDAIHFDAQQDRLWFVGDLVNRGPKSADTLRLIASLGDAAVTVLGNHDLFMLASAQGHGKAHAGDTFEEVLDAPDAPALLDWLANQKMAHQDTINGQTWLMAHAGVLPSWNSQDVLRLAREAEAALRDGNFFSHMRGNQPAHWDETLSGHDRIRAIVNALTRLRFCTPAGEMEFTTKTETAPPGYLAWYEVPRRATAKVNVLFGHWAARGLTLRDHVVGIDTGCVWGRQLTALRLEDRRVVQVDCLAGIRGYGAG